MGRSASLPKITDTKNGQAELGLAVYHRELLFRLAIPPGSVALALTVAAAMQLFVAIRRDGLRGSNIGPGRTLILAWRLNVAVLVLTPIRVRHLVVLILPGRTLIRFGAWLVVHMSSVGRSVFSVTRVAFLRSFLFHDTAHTALARSRHDTLIGSSGFGAFFSE
jgi:hypothetical protein